MFVEGSNCSAICDTIIEITWRGGSGGNRGNLHQDSGSVAEIKNVHPSACQKHYHWELPPG